MSTELNPIPSIVGITVISVLRKNLGETLETTNAANFGSAPNSLQRVSTKGTLPMNAALMLHVLFTEVQTSKKELYIVF